MTQIIKSPNDRREFEHIELENGLQILLVSDKETSICSASLAVNIGSYYDTIPGMAHFLEHLLFMGSKKYSGENDYDQIVKNYNGMTNAYTSGSITNYFFSCVSEGLFEVLDVFAQFFICPLFNNDGVKRELHAVHSEYIDATSNNEWRFDHCLKEFMEESHPEKKFMIGSKDTLDIENIREIVISFYKKNYSSDLMKLVVVGKENLNILKEKIVPMFRPIRKILNKNIIKNIGYVFKPNSFGMIETNQNIKKVNIFWEYELSDEYDKYNLDNFLLYLLENEMPNSLHQNLYKKYYINNLNANMDYEYKYHKAINLELEITKIGYKNMTKLLNFIDAYIKKLSNLSFDDLKILYEDYSKILDIKFNNYNVSNPIDFCYNLSHMWIKNDIESDNLLKYNYRHSEFDDDLYEVMIYMFNLIKINNASIFVRTNNLQTKYYLTEEKMQVKYKRLAEMNFNNESIIIDEIIGKNNYLSLDINKIEYIFKEQYPIKIKNENNMNIWFKYDVLNNSKIYFKIIITRLNSLQEQLYQDIFFKIINYHAKAKIYEIGAADYNINIKSEDNSIIIKLNGYPNKIYDILNYFISLIKEINDNKKKYIDERLFNYIINIYKLHNENIKYSELEEQIELFAKSELSTNIYNHEEKLELLENITYCDFITFNILDKEKVNNVDGLVQGNIDYERANEIFSLIKILNLNIESYKYLELENKSDNNIIKYVNNNNEKNINYTLLINMKCENYNFNYNYPKQSIILNILHNILGTNYFDELRTKEQLGYSIYSNPIRYGINKKQLRIFYKFNIKSPNKEIIDGNEITSDYIKTRVNNFLLEFKNYLDNYEEEKIILTINSIKNQLNSPFQNIKEESKYNLNKILNGNNIFNLKEIQKEIVKNINKKDLIEFYNEYFLKNIEYLSFEFKNNN